MIIIMQMGFANFCPIELPVFMVLGGILDQAIAFCCHIILVVNPCSDTQIKLVACGYLRKSSLNCFISHGAPCHVSWWVYFAVCCFGPLNALLYVYICYTACFPAIIYIAPHHCPSNVGTLSMFNLILYTPFARSTGYNILVPIFGTCHK